MQKVRQNEDDSCEEGEEEEDSHNESEGVVGGYQHPPHQN